MNIQHYFFDGIEYAQLPDPFEGVSPMTEECFVDMGGGIVVDGGCTVNGVAVAGGTYTSIVSSGGSAVVN